MEMRIGGKWGCRREERERGSLIRLLFLPTPGTGLSTYVAGGWLEIRSVFRSAGGGLSGTIRRYYIPTSKVVGNINVSDVLLSQNKGQEKKTKRQNSAHGKGN